MADTPAAAGRTWRYRFLLPDGTEIETGERGSDDAAVAHARELSSAKLTAVTVERHDMVDWEYVTEVDERP
jgi:hypothetical protein